MDIENPVDLLRALAYVALSDTRVSAEERAAFEKTMASLALSEEVKEQGRAFLSEAPTLEDVARHLTREPERSTAVRQALLMAHSDDRYSVLESEKIERLAAALGIEPAGLAAIEATIEGYLPPPASTSPSTSR